MACSALHVHIYRRGRVPRRHPRTSSKGDLGLVWHMKLLPLASPIPIGICEWIIHSHCEWKRTHIRPRRLAFAFFLQVTSWSMLPLRVCLPKSTHGPLWGSPEHPIPNGEQNISFCPLEASHNIWKLPAKKNRENFGHALLRRCLAHLKTPEQLTVSWSQKLSLILSGVLVRYTSWLLQVTLCSFYNIVDIKLTLVKGK